MEASFREVPHKARSAALTGFLMVLGSPVSAQRRISKDLSGVRTFNCQSAPTTGPAVRCLDYSAAETERDVDFAQRLQLYRVRVGSGCVVVPFGARDAPQHWIAITIDAGDPDDIHPVDKKPAGERLALWSLGERYGRDVPHVHPTLNSVERLPGALRLGFDHTDGGLVVKGNKPGEFSLAGDDPPFPTRW